MFWVTKGTARLKILHGQHGRRASAERESARSRGAMAGLLEDTDLPATLSKDIQWESYLSARLVSEKDVQLIRRYDKRTPELRASMLEEAGPAYVQALLSVLRAVTKDDTVQYVLALLLQMLQENPLRAKYFHQTPDPESASSLDPYTVFLRLLQRQEWVAQEKAAKLLTAIIDSRPMKSLAFNNGILSSDPSSALQLASFGGPDPAEAHISSFVDWLIGQMKRPSAVNKSVPISISILAVLLRERGTRQLFLRAGGVQLLPSMIKSSNSPANSQLLYELCLCAWQMTFLAAGADALGKAGIVRPLVEVTRVAQKEKVFRIAMSALRNLLDRPELHDTLAPEMVDAGLQKIVITKQMQVAGAMLHQTPQPHKDNAASHTNRLAPSEDLGDSWPDVHAGKVTCRAQWRGAVAGRSSGGVQWQGAAVAGRGCLLQGGFFKRRSLLVALGNPCGLLAHCLCPMQAWGDDDIVELLKYMDEQLKHGIKVLSNFDKYKREVASGQLDWSPMHTSEAFWKEHADKFEERDFMVLRALLKLLESSREVKTLAVACSDVGMFIVHHPQGRYIVNDLRGKELVMRLMAHPDPDVQKQALLTVQKIMITRDKLEPIVISFLGPNATTIAHADEIGKLPLAFCHVLQHCGRYDAMFRTLAASGIAVHSFDAHGHGRSQPTEAQDRAVIWEFQHLLDDLALVVEDALRGAEVEGEAAVPMFLGGQSMGGLVAAHAALGSQPAWSGLILHSAALGVEWTPVLKAQAPVGALLGKLLPRARIVPAVRPEDMSPDPKAVAAYVSDPLNTVGPVAARTGAVLLDAFQSLAKRNAAFTLPIYAAHGTHDKCTSLPAVRRMVGEASSRDKQLREVEGGYHELLLGEEADNCIRPLVAWIQQHAAPRSKL
ncbi:hypothetical protein QJQ45_022950 [Haematococcus lacustris]|nr:hypothetical protein QJQ45_022950 [Haematococcus lacustris]